MPNPLTGDYQAVVQIAMRQINGLLGALHQNADQNAALKLLHSTSSRIGDTRRRRPDVGAFGDWVLAYQKTRRGRGIDALRAQLTATAPPGTAKMFSDAFDRFDHEWDIQLDPAVVRGGVKLQASNVTMSVPAGSSSEVTIHAHVRAHYYPDPDTTELPAPVHGEVRAGFDISQDHRAGRRLLIKPSAQDSKIEFAAAPGSGLTALETSRISAEVRRFLREGLTMLPVDLPDEFIFTEFKGLGSGANQVIALPFQLSNSAPPASGVQGITQSFIGSSGFGFAVSKDHVASLIDLEAIRQSVASQTPKFTVSYGLGSTTVTYRLSFSSGPTLTFKTGGIEISGRVEAKTNTIWAPNGWVSFKQLITIDVDPATQAISVRRAGEPEVDEAWFIPHARAVNIVRSEVDKALARNGTAVRRVFHDARSDLRNGLRMFDTGVSVSFTAIEITINGVIVRGEIGSVLARRPPVIEIGETHGGSAFTAFKSWIPAGRINRFVWTWVEYPDFGSIWQGVEKSLVAEHSFILTKPSGITSVGQVCLRLEGTQVTPSGQTVPIAGGATCRVQEPEMAMDIPSWWGPVTIPFFRPDLAETGTVRQAIAGHIGVHSSPGEVQRQRNTLVYFVDGRDKALDPLIEALSQAKSASSIVTTVVLPAGTFDASRREVEDRLGLSREISSSLHFTEDDEGGWTRTFGVSKTPSMYLLNARREFVWKHEGEPDPATVAAALDEFVVPTAPSDGLPLRLAVSPGDAAPDAAFADGGRGYALHRLRGREVFVNFWQSWSAPCLTELERLQRLHADGGQAPSIVAFHGGTDAKAVDDVRKRLGLSFPVVQDPQQQIARRYGVRCWPTTIKIDADGRVEHIQFGTAHQHKPPQVGDKSAAAE
jgi:peroxiredoxin